MYLLRVDDCGWKPEDKSDDLNLEYFTRWRNALDPQGCPVFYGFIPSTVHAEEQALLRKMLTGRETVAIHGWDHDRGAVVPRRLMTTAIRSFAPLCGPCPVYIPPFNDYNTKQIYNWSAAAWDTKSADCVFMGGFDEPGRDGDKHHEFGELPVLLDGAVMNRRVVHLPATRKLYARAQPLLATMRTLSPGHVPRTITLHATWDIHGFGALGELVDLIRPYLIGTDELFQWFRKTRMTARELTGPHHAAYSWICERIKQLDLDVMDFGARYSKLPAQLALRDCKVLAVDRDPTMPEHQAKLATQYGVQVETKLWDGSTPWVGDKRFDVITACWALQHNLEDGGIERLVEQLYDLLKPGGRFLCVTSRAPTGTRVDRNRVDPQIIMDDRTFKERVISGAEWELVDRRPFHYEHGSHKYQWDAPPEEANAACYEMRRVK